MNKQNLLPSKFVAKYTVTYLLSVAIKCLLPILIMTLGMVTYSKYLDYYIDKGEKQLTTVADNKEKYDDAKEIVNRMQESIKSNDERLKYVQSLHGDFSKFDILMTYLVDLKPYNIAFISIEDFDVVPPPNLTSDVVTKPTVSDILDGEEPKVQQGTSGTNQVISTEEQPIGDTKPVGTDGTVDKPVNSENIISEARKEYDETKYDESLTYSRDISLSHILIRGYCTDIDAISDYVTSVASAPEIEGYTLEGVEDKVTNIKGTNIILFEIKLKMKGVVEQ